MCYFVLQMAGAITALNTQIKTYLQGMFSSTDNKNWLHHLTLCVVAPPAAAAAAAWMQNNFASQSRMLL
jgi:hypothetical protein